MMIGCAELDGFFDGQLGRDQAAAFRDHLARCERCERVLHGRMQEALIADAARDVRSPDAQTRRRARRRAVVVGGGAAVLAAAATAVVTLARHAPAPHTTPLQVALSVEHVGPTMRGKSAHPGDALHVHARGARHRAIWVYKNERELVAACPDLRAGGPRVSGCVVTADALELELSLTTRGTYAIVTLGAAATLPLPSGSLDADIAAASSIDGSYQIGHVEVD